MVPDRRGRTTRREDQQVQRLSVQMEIEPQSVREAVQVLRSLLGPVRAEPGCSATRLLRDLDDERAVTFVEEWRDGASLQRHLRTATFRRILAVMELAAAAPTVEIDEITSRRGIDMVEEILGDAPAEGAEGSAA
jgi:quinol monooxygenase YgiN